jgi:hypothetical protein
MLYATFFDSKFEFNFMKVDSPLKIERSYCQMLIPEIGNKIPVFDQTSITQRKIRVIWDNYSVSSDSYHQWDYFCSKFISKKECFSFETSFIEFPNNAETSDCQIFLHSGSLENWLITSSYVYSSTPSDCWQKYLCYCLLFDEIQSTWIDTHNKKEYSEFRNPIIPCWIISTGFDDNPEESLYYHFRELYDLLKKDLKDIKKYFKPDYYLEYFTIPDSFEDEFDEKEDRLKRIDLMINQKKFFGKKKEL